MRVPSSCCVLTLALVVVGYAAGFCDVGVGVVGRIVVVGVAECAVDFCVVGCAVGFCVTECVVGL